MQRRDFLAALTVAPAPLSALAVEVSQTPAPRAAKRLTITLLGTGTPAPSLVRQGSGYLVEVGSDAAITGTTRWWRRKPA